VIPVTAGCCGFAGDRGFALPELTRTAAREEGAEVRRLGGAHHVSTARTCEIAMSRASGRRYTSLVHLVRESLLG
jgi:D-lactate dehydrogenase